MLLTGTAQRSDIPWASPLNLVPKKEDGWRPCGDYRVLNARIVPDQYSVWHIAHFAHQLAGRKVFSKIDLVKSLTPDPSSSVRRWQHSHHYALWTLRVSLFLLRTPKCRANISAVHR